MTSLRSQQAGRDAASFDDDRKELRYDRSYFSALSETPDCPFEKARMAEVSRICNEAADYVHAAIERARLAEIERRKLARAA